MDDTKALARQEFRQHWTLIMAAAIGFLFGSVSTSSAGLFMEPIGNEFGWSRALLSSGTTIAALVGFFTSPLLGMAIDRWGTRRMALFGIVGTMGVFYSLSLMTGQEWQWFALWLAYAVFGMMIKSTVWSASVSSVFEHGRGLALGLTLSGTAVSQAIIPPITHFLIEAYGWRGAYIGLGLGAGSIAFIFCLLFLFDGYDLARRPKKDGAAPQGAMVNAPGLSIPEAWRSEALWRIAISTFVMMILTIALNVHQFEILRGVGVGRQEAAFYTGVTGAAGVVGKLATGWLMDRYHARWVGSLTLGVTVAVFLVLLLPNQSAPIIVTAMFINGYAAGTKLQIASFLTSAYGGMKHFGAIFGTMASLIALGSGLGPLAAGYIYDVYHTYDPFLYFGIAGTLFSSWLIFGLRDYPRWQRKEAEVFA